LYRAQELAFRTQYAELRGLVLTDAGETLLAYAHRLLEAA
jgi:DNA-binding transcriptional LysR family regulator